MNRRHRLNFGNYGKWIFLGVSAIVVTAFLYFSNILVNDLAERERERMVIWADATKEILRQYGDNASETGEVSAAYTSFLLNIIEGNKSIPVLLVDETGAISQHRNFNLPDPYEVTDTYPELTERNRNYLAGKLDKLSHTPNVIDIEIGPTTVQHLYYEDSTLLQRLSYFPYVQLVVMIVFLLVVYLAVSSGKEAEQNKVWVGLSKETAHQLGTPISSLMAWVELLPEMGVDADTCKEMNKDVRRLSTIASRFSKIGSAPSIDPTDLGELVDKASAYMASRISSRISLTTSLPQPADALTVNASAPLFEWVMENLIKNAVDAMEGEGRIDVRVFAEGDKAVIEVSDTGRGIPSKLRKRIFKPGYTTKKRGWGLGLTLAKRIVEQYHHGKIRVKDSSPGKGTTFRIELPTV